MCKFFSNFVPDFKKYSYDIDCRLRFYQMPLVFDDR